MRKIMLSRLLLTPFVTLVFMLVLSIAATAGTVSDWIQVMDDTVVAGGTNPLHSTRNMAIVAAAMFDAVNGIERRYSPLHVPPDAPRGASRRAAAIQAAYATLVALYPAQAVTLGTRYEADIAALTDDDDDDDSNSVARGIQWGQTVADAILAWRATDGFSPAPPPYLGDTTIGDWRPTPPAFAAGFGPQFATMTPWVIASPDEFRPAGPPALTSAEYAAAFNEVKSMGAATGSGRTQDQTDFAVFWNFNTPIFWNRIAQQVASRRHYSLSQEARLFGMLNVAMADAGIACWEAKYHFHAWRPITAIGLADQDSNPATDVDLAWTPLLVTPPHPEYPSGHSTVSGAAVRVLSQAFGDKTFFTLTSETLPGMIRSYTSFSSALAEIHNARVYGGIHFRPACRDGSAVGMSVANYVMQHAFQRRH
jgi:PAP2 superfamily